MKPMTKENLRNIRLRFEEKTGVALTPKPVVSGRKLWVLAAAIICCLAMAAFGSPLFSSLNGDELSLSGTYLGGGKVAVQVENRSNKPLRFQETTRLIRWITGQEAPRLGGTVVFENTEFPPHSQGTMVLDISEAYDVAALEEAPAKESYYFLLTNNGFLFGQDWMCSVTFGTEPREESKETPVEVNMDIQEGIIPDLRFYFEETYTDTPMAFNEANFQYQQKVEEILARSEAQVVRSLSPLFMVGGPSEFLDPEPVLHRIPEGVLFDGAVAEDRQYLLTNDHWSYTDGFGRMVATVEEKAWVIDAMLPEYAGQTDGGAGMPLIYLFVYDAEEAKPENSAFIYGQIVSFEELEDCLVLRDEHFAVYNATALIYGDVDRYLDAFLALNPHITWDEGLRQRVRNIYEYYMDRKNITELYDYLQIPET